VRFAKRTDANHSQIREALRAAGYPVLDLSGCGNGVPDLSVLAAPGKAVFLEVKVSEKEKLTKAEETWFKFNASYSRVVYSVEHALRVVREIGEG
jgi:hypothetical protein